MIEPINASGNVNLALKFGDYASLKEKIDRLTEQLDAMKAEIMAYSVPGRTVLCRGYAIVCDESGYSLVIAPPVFAPDEGE